MRRRRLALMVLFAAACVLAKYTHADAKDAGPPAAVIAAKSDRNAYDMHLSLGLDLMTRNDPERACIELEKATKAMSPQPDARALFAFGKCLQKTNRMPEAWRAVRDAMLIPPSSEPDAGTERADMANLLEDIAKTVGLVVVRAECDSKPITARVDGIEVPPGPIALPPGGHKVALSCALGDVQRDVMLRAGGTVEIEIPIDAWQSANGLKSDKDTVRQPSGCGCSVVGL